VDPDLIIAKEHRDLKQNTHCWQKYWEYGC